jgi:hypothetical protein
MTCPPLHRRPGCRLRFVGKIDNSKALRSQAFDVSPFVFEAALLEHARVGIVPCGLRYLAFREAKVHSREMTAR